jgi:hypothetical protein
MAIIDHNYNLKLLRLHAEGKVPTGGLWHADIRHDDWCAVFRGQYCDCDPDIRFVDDATWEREQLTEKMRKRPQP